jgi:hypothetical protein
MAHRSISANPAGRAFPIVGKIFHVIELCNTYLCSLKIKQIENVRETKGKYLCGLSQKRDHSQVMEVEHYLCIFSYCSKLP